MDAVAAVAGHLSLGVRGPADLGPAETLGVTAETVVHDRFGAELGKRHDLGLVALGRYVLAARTVATFTPCAVGWLVTRGLGLEVWVPVEIHCDVRMAGPARGTAGERRGGSEESGKERQQRADKGITTKP